AYVVRPVSGRIPWATRYPDGWMHGSFDASSGSGFEIAHENSPMDLDPLLRPASRGSRIQR
ncbi:MAG TPA: hypothetical protein PLY87_18625, partial [Planctomycetaceae bacterium]|nr:hypothetical protein [Planctomycetaceae bacterium]HQZ67117.1 hypothetical protein [Planctomycetaceae bacterium]